MLRRLILVLAAVLAPLQARAAEDGSLGALRFPVTGGTPQARDLFVRGVLAMHSFWYEEAERLFAEATRADPTFAMGFWGLAMSHSKLLWQEDALRAGRAALEAVPAGEVTPRERAYLGAARALFGDGDNLSRRQAFAAAMEKIHRDFPDDDEASLFLSLALLTASPPDDPNDLAVRSRAAGLAMEVMARNPSHPGAAHYIIHALDTPELAPLALPAARAYAKIAPAAYHARHMPAHIFSRLGMWREAYDSCVSAWQASVEWTQREKLSPDKRDYHSLSWMEEIAFELGQRKAADEAMKIYADAVRGGLGYLWRSGYAFQVASYIARTGEAARVDELLAPLSAPAVESDDEVSSACTLHAGQAPKRPPHEHIERLAAARARALAAAMRRDPAAARKALDEVDAMRKATASFFQGIEGKDSMVKFDRMAALDREALLAEARGADGPLLAALRKKAEIEDTFPAGEGTSDGLLTHERIAAALLRTGHAREALGEYEKVIKKHAGRAQAHLGAARAATRAGDAEAARRHYRQLADLWAGADEGFPGLAEARAGAR